MKLSQAWWVCNVCKKPIQKVKKGGGKLRPKDIHNQECPKATYSIKQIIK